MLCELHTWINVCIKLCIFFLLEHMLHMLVILFNFETCIERSMAHANVISNNGG
jgi:hypothetical protein